MFKFTPSEFYRNYCKENGIEITDCDLAAAILNDDFDPPNGERTLLEEKQSELKKIAAKTKNSELKDMISEMIKHNETTMEKLKTGGKNCVYKVDITYQKPNEEDWHRFAGFYFYDYDTAFKYVLSHAGDIGILYSFMIYRLKIFTGEESPKTCNFMECANFNSSGKILWISDNKKSIADKLRAHSAAVNPFNDLDIVMHCSSGEIGIARGSEYAPGITVHVLFEGGYTLAVNPMCLEKIDSNSKPILRKRSIKVIREQLNRFDDEERTVLEKMITKLSDV